MEVEEYRGASVASYLLFLNIVFELFIMCCGKKEFSIIVTIVVDGLTRRRAGAGAAATM